MKFNVKEVVVKDLSGVVIPVSDLDKSLGNLIYKGTSTIDWLNKAKEIHEGKEVDLTTQEVGNIVLLVRDEKCTFINAVKDAIIDYITNLSTEEVLEQDIHVSQEEVIK